MQGLVAGIDEVGRGALAGPMVMAVAAFATNRPPVEGITDSKKLTPRKRSILAPQITKAAAFVGFGWVDPWEIDELGMTRAWQLCSTRTLEGAPEIEMLFVDGTDYIESYQDLQKPVPKADLTIWQVGAASIIAKRMRDMEMEYLSSHYPGYGWEKNSGYGAKAHIAGLDMMGPTREHRRLFLRKWARKKGADL